jgi:hypothetical protein
MRVTLPFILTAHVLQPPLYPWTRMWTLQYLYQDTGAICTRTVDLSSDLLTADTIEMIPTDDRQDIHYVPLR